MTLESLTILGKKSIFVGHNFLDFVVSDLLDNFTSSKYVLLTDKNLAKLHLEDVKNAFSKKGIDLLTKILESGEQTKCREVKAGIEDWMLGEGCSRDTIVIAFGGGVIGDLSGYVAATFMRGVRVVQLPTSLLAMVDSSVGGKTGIDTPHGKNLVGAFHQPIRIYMDTHFLTTLPERQLSNGMAEVIKTAAIWNVKEFAYLENHADEVFSHDLDVLSHIVLESARVKAQVVTEDEFEGGLRGLLNFGHSIGHAVEALSQPEMLHGEAVAIGMLQEVELSRALGYAKQEAVGRLTRCMQLYKLKTKMPTHLKVSDLMEKMAVDKKNKNGKKYIVLLSSVGTVAARQPIQVEDKDIEICMSDYMIVNPLKGIKGRVQVPGSKSISNRVLLLAALGNGQCSLTGLLHSDDTKVMLDALTELGVSHRSAENGSVLIIEGSGGGLQEPSKEIYLGNAGTASRFLTTSVTLLRKVCDIILTGNARMKERPIGPLVDALRKNGLEIEFMENQGSLPLLIRCKDGLPGGEICLEANVSSQYVSSVLIASPYAKSPVKLALVGGEVVSQPYIDMTLQLMEQFGCEVKRLPNSDVYESPTCIYQNPSAFLVEGDASSATYPSAIAAISGGEITVTNVGSVSLQGDAQFCRLLEKMGCQVSQTDVTTTVKGPEIGTLKAINIDMMTMTDAFMTAAVLCSVANGVSQLTGIANQRVKECDRLAVMVEEFGKMGVKARELPDGIEIEGQPYSEHRGKGVVINCHDDHRIAMSFAVLGCLVPDITISEKHCVEKTYPEFWDDLRTKFNVSLNIPGSVQAHHSQGPAKSSRQSHVLIGMRGAGKSSLGAAIAKSLKMKLVDVDHYLESVFQSTILEFVNKNGWDAFRQEEEKHFGIIMNDPTYLVDHVIVCGGGIVENASCRTLLKNYENVIEVNRYIEDIVAYLESDKERPVFAEHPRDVYKRRQAWYEECRTHIFPLLKGETQWSLVEKEFCDFVDRLSSGVSILEKIPSHSFFVCTTYDDLTPVVDDLSELCEGSQVIELRVDLLKDRSTEFICQQMAILRRHCNIPVIFTVRSQEQGGAFVDSEKEMFKLLSLGCALGCEFVDVETELSENARLKFYALQKYSKIISSYHVPRSAMRTDWDSLKSQFDKANANGSVDVVKVVAKATEFDDVFKLEALRKNLDIETPVITIAMGPKGALSRVLNTFMTPVTHSILPTAAAPGQLSVKEINQIRGSIGMLSPKEFSLFGKPIQQSMSPTIHNTGFQDLNLPYVYTLRETDNVKDFVAAFEESQMFGASVTIPLKEKIQPYLTSLSDSATKIGAVNTVIKDDAGNLRGDNTDWIGITRCLKLGLKKKSEKVNSSNIDGGLVIGAGGTARAALYALKQMGVPRIFVYNRTFEKAQKLATEFSVETWEDLSALKTPIHLVVSTVPAQSEITLPETVTCNQPVILDAAYRPKETKLLAHGRAHGCIGIEGIEMLIEQGLEQFQLWTDFKGPSNKIREIVYKKYDE